MTISAEEAGALVGLEIHQQLDTGRKLFCGCNGAAPPGYQETFTRRLRPVRSEMGRHDPAALFEDAKSRTMIYRADSNNSCMVERDEEPPHEMDPASKEVVLSVAAALHSRVFPEIYPMRKTVIDGSNTGGFQRTMLVAQGGTLETPAGPVGVQSICLEEDSARVLGGDGNTKEYGLDRLGIPLIEIALDPIRGTPRAVRDVAQSVGRLLRGTRKVARGIGSIRQDVNVSVRGGGGVVEIKGMQQLDQLERVVEYEVRRQSGLLRIAAMITRTPDISPGDVFQVADILEGCGSKIVRDHIRRGSHIMGIRARGLAGVLGHTPFPDVRLGMELGQVAKSYGIGGVFHSDELPGYGMGPEYVESLRAGMGAGPGDAFVLVAGPPDMVGTVARAIADRMARAKEGVPAETRLATPDGRTVFLRPRPGSSRMYPETDIPPVYVSSRDLEEAARNAPKPWDVVVSGTAAKHGINMQLAEQLLDSPYVEVFEMVVRETSAPPAFVASCLCSEITGLVREGLDQNLLRDDTIQETFGLLDAGRISKEAVSMIFGEVMAGRAASAAEAADILGAASMSEEEISHTLDALVAENLDMVRRQKGRAAGPLMGMAMSRLRGRASGEAVSRILAEKIRRAAGE